MILDNVLLTPKTLGPIVVQVAIEESYTDELQITDHPVERGAEITDHAFMRMPTVTMQCGWSNSDYAALGGILQALRNGSAMTSSQYVQQVYSQLLALQESAQPFSVTTGMRTYENMLFKSLTVRRDAKTGNALLLQATLRQVHIVQTRATTLPPRANQADAARTGETESAGNKAATPAQPAPGGAVPPEKM